MKVFITGANGQVGTELQQRVPHGIEVEAFDRTELDISDLTQVELFLSREKPKWVINAAAYTAVDKAEEEQELAYKINSQGAENIALVCEKLHIKMLQVSTDFVFDGKQGSPYLTTSKPNPLSVYGASKLQGDEAVIKHLGNNACIVRTSWVYSAHGNNFVKTMLRFMEERSELNIITDQIGTPTWAKSLAAALWQVVSRDLSGVLNWSDYGVASWYDFAVAINEEATALGMLSNPCLINPIRTDQYPLPATRPAFSVLDKSFSVDAIGLIPMHWRSALREMLLDLKSM